MGFYIVQVLTGLSSAAALFLVASGLSIIFGVTRVVNFAHGSFYMLGAYIAYSVIELFGREAGAMGFWGGIVLAALAVGAIGAIVEILILRRVYQAPELFQLVATFGVILVVQDVALWVWGAEDLVGHRAPGLTGAVEILGTPLPEYDLVLILISPVVLIGLWLLFNRTRWGTLVRAATQDREMVGALGVNQAWLFTGTFFLGSLLAGLGGAVQLPKGGADLLMDFNIIAAAFVVVVVGGMGSIFGALLAAVLIAELNAFGILIFCRDHPGADVPGHGGGVDLPPVGPVGKARGAGPERPTRTAGTTLAAGALPGADGRCGGRRLSRAVAGDRRPVCPGSHRRYPDLRAVCRQPAFHAWGPWRFGVVRTRRVFTVAAHMPPRSWFTTPIRNMEIWHWRYWRAFAAGF